MVIFMKDNGKIIQEMVKENIHIMKVELLMGIGIMELKKEKEILNGLMEVFMREIGKKTKDMV